MEPSQFNLARHITGTPSSTPETKVMAHLFEEILEEEEGDVPDLIPGRVFVLPLAIEEMLLFEPEFEGEMLPRGSSRGSPRPGTERPPAPDAARPSDLPKTAPAPQRPSLPPAPGIAPSPPNPSVQRMVPQPPTRQEINFFVATVKQAVRWLETAPPQLPAFKALLMPGQVLAPPVRIFLEKITLWEALLQKFSDNPKLPLRQELEQLKELSIKTLLLPEEKELSFPQREEKMELLLQGPLQPRMQAVGLMIASLPVKEETEIELLQRRLLTVAEMEEASLPVEPRVEKVPYPISLQFSHVIQNRGDIIAAVRALEGGDKRKILLLPLSKGGNRQPLVYVPPGKLVEPSLDLEGFLIGVVPMTNFPVVAWLNSLMAEGKINVKNGRVFFERHMLLLKTKEAAYESQIEVRAGENSLYFATEKGAEDHPVVHISWQGADLFCRHADLRLPSEAEWQRAAAMRGDQEKFKYGFSSNEIDPTWANYDRGKGSAQMNRTTPVGFYNGLHLFTHQGKTLVTKNSVSPWGCYDMSGNVREWTSEGSACGGSYLSPPGELEVGVKRVLNREETYPDVGFRLALSAAHS